MAQTPHMGTVYTNTLHVPQRSEQVTKDGSGRDCGIDVALLPPPLPCSLYNPVGIKGVLFCICSY